MTDWLLDTLLWTSALMLLVLLVREPVRRQFGAGVAYALWLVPAARIAMPTLTHTVERAAPASTPAAMPASLPVTTPAAFAETPILLPAAAAPVDVSLVDQLGGWPVILLSVWLGGAVLLFANRMLDYARERRRILADADRVSKVGNIRIVRSGAVEGPLAFGVIDRVVAVPDHFWTHYTPAERRLALAHELAHHRSGDLVANMIAFVLLSLQWFNPLAWTSYAAFRFDQEAACDARVLDRADDRAAYGRAIAKAASGRSLMFASALDSKSTLKRRLNAMMKSTPKTHRRIGNLMVIGVVAAALPLTATKAVEYVETARAADPMMDADVSVDLFDADDTVDLFDADESVDIMVDADEDMQEAHSLSDKPYSQMSAQERREFDAGMASLREALEEIREERVDVRADIAEAMADARQDIDREEIAAEMAEARREIEEAMAEIEAERGELEAQGVDPEVIKASLRAAMASVEAIDIDGIVSASLASIDPEAMQAQVEASLEAAESSIRMSLEQMEAQRRR